MMSLILLVLLGVSATWASNVEDFADDYMGFTFIFHDSKDLVLIMHENRCYFHHITEDQKAMLQGGGIFTSGRKWSEMYLISMIRSPESGVVVRSTLDQMRDKFHDLLADFQCQGKEVYELFNTKLVGSHWGHNHHGSHDD